MSDALSAVRRSHNRFTALVTPLSETQVQGPSYDDDWSIADVASHLGSQAEIFLTFLDSGLAGKPAAGNDTFPPIWDRWNAKAPADQVADSVSANGALVTRLDTIPEDQRAAFHVQLFGMMDVDLDGFARVRLGEHAVHTWDIAVALDPAATVAQDAVDLLVEQLPSSAGRRAKAVSGADPVVVTLSDRSETYRITLDPAVNVERLDDADDGAAASPNVRMPSEAFVRLVYGRLDPLHTPDSVTDDGRLDDLRRAFPGF